MLINQNTAVHSKQILLIPYCRHHVEHYHDWMKDAELQMATASEPLTLDKEFEMQNSWRNDSDKLTFITCQAQNDTMTMDRSQEILAMVGDVNLFISIEQEGNADLSLVGEVELMVAQKSNRRRGFGRAALSVFLAYIVKHEKEILDEYFSTTREIQARPNFSYLRAKIGESNQRSLNLFEKTGFAKSETTPNYFGEWELRKPGISEAYIENLLRSNGIEGYQETQYP